MDDETAREVVAMQFAGGIPVARLVVEWEKDQAWVEEAIRQALLATIPQRDGGLKVPRTEARAGRSEETAAVRGMQSLLFGSTCDSAEE